MLYSVSQKLKCQACTDSMRWQHSFKEQVIEHRYLQHQSFACGGTDCWRATVVAKLKLTKA
jgi:hypothetical protein